MDFVYDIFERLPDGGFSWRGSVSSKEAALAKLGELSRDTKNELFARDLSSQQTIAIRNVSGNEAA